MTAAYIEELDRSAAVKKVLAELLDTDKYAMAGVIYNGATLVSTGNPFPVVDATAALVQQALTGASSAGGATSLAKKPGQTPGATDLGVNLMGIRTDTIGDVSELVGKWTPLRFTRRGAALVELASALDSSSDSIYARPYGQGATLGFYTKRFTAQAGEVAIAAPGAGFRIVITNVRIACRGTTAGQISVFQDTDAGSDYDAAEPAVVDDDYAPTTAVPVGSKSGPLHFVCGDNKRVYVLSSTAISFTLMIDYFIEATPA